MATLIERKVACIVGGFVADAAAQPVHWVYDLNLLGQALGAAEAVEFHEPPKNPFYSIPVGRNSCYGDQAYVLLESLVRCKGLDTDDLKTKTYAYFGPDTEYDTKGTKVPYPIKGPWKNSSLKHFEANYEAGRAITGSDTDQQIDGVTRIAPLIAMFAGHPDMLDMVEQAVKVTQNAPLAVATVLAAARLLEKLVLHGAKPIDAVSDTIQDLLNPSRLHPHDLDTQIADTLSEVLRVKDKPHYDVVTQVFGNK